MRHSPTSASPYRPHSTHAQALSHAAPLLTYFLSMCPLDSVSVTRPTYQARLTTHRGSVFSVISHSVHSVYHSPLQVVCCSSTCLYEQCSARASITAYDFARLLPSVQFCATFASALQTVHRPLCLSSDLQFLFVLLTYHDRHCALLRRAAPSCQLFRKSLVLDPLPSHVSRHITLR